MLHSLELFAVFAEPMMLAELSFLAGYLPVGNN